jgi:hypothetical protein
MLRVFSSWALAASGGGGPFDSNRAWEHLGNSSHGSQTVGVAGIEQTRLHQEAVAAGGVAVANRNGWPTHRPERWRW